MSDEPVDDAPSGPPAADLPPPAGAFPPIEGQYASPPPGPGSPPPPQYGQPQNAQPQQGRPQYPPSQYGQPQFPPPQYGQPQYAQPQYPPPPGAPGSYVPGQYGQPQYPPPGWAGGPVPARTTNGFAIASLVTGIVGCIWITPILAIVFGLVARSQIRKSNGRQTGGGMAIAGIVLGGLWIALLGTFVVLAATGQLDEDVPTRGQFVTVVSDAMEDDPSVAGRASTPEQDAAIGLATDDFASCIYDAYVDEPAYLNEIYDDPLADEYRVPGVSQSRIDELDEQGQVCVDTLGATLREILGG